MNDLTPAQAIWGKFYLTLHQEVERLSALVEQKKNTSPAIRQDESGEVLTQRQPKAGVKSDSSHS